MKTNHFLLLLVFISITFSSCEFEEGSSNYTPEILPYAIIDQNNDSLGLYYTDESGVYLMDTISIGDTITFKMIFSGVTNNLTSLYLYQSSDSSAKVILPDKNELDSIFLSTSEYDKGKFYMDGTKTLLYLPLHYIPMKKSNEAKISFTLVSDADFSNYSLGFGSNTTSIAIKTPIK
jgi:hypothetical protein